MLNMKRHLALVAALLLAAGAGTGCSAKKSEGNAKVTVTASAVVVADINHIDLTITGGAGEAGFPITATLSKTSTGKEWTGNITNIPAGAGRLFHAVAYKAPGTAAADKIFEGEATTEITAGATASVTIILQELNVPPGQTNYAPAITSLTSSNAYVVPGTHVNFAVGANDPDHNGDPLLTAWSASCTAGGNGTFSAAASAATDWTAPGQNATCTITVTVTESATNPPAIPNNNGKPLSVATSFTVTVNGNFGRADVAAFPNSFPIITARADVRYNFFADVLTMPVGQQADFSVDAIDPDGDNVRYDLKAQCGSDLVAAASAAALDPSYFTTTTSIMGTPSSWLPKFGVAPAATYTNPNQDCVFTITVQDLCTAGNCGGALADGADKATQIAGVEVKSFTTAIINATHPAQAKRAPSIVRVSAPNQLGPVAIGVQTWDAEKVVIVEPSKPYTFGAEAADPFELGTLSVAWSCAVGSVGTPVNTANLKSEMTWTAPASLAAGMTCTATFTSSASSLSTVATFKLSGSDECLVNAWAAGHACSTGNACITGETCQAAGSTTLCGGGSAVVCPVTDGQCQDAVCSPVSGCGVSNRADTLACNADSNGCSQGDHCSAGACVAGTTTPACNTPADAQCQSAAGTCSSTGNATFSCVYAPVANGTVCNADSNGCTQNDACLAGACTAGTPATCTQTANVCQATTGTCSSTSPSAYACNFANLDGQTCNTAGLCVTGQSCQSGTCQGGTPLCAANQTCNPVGPVCEDILVPRPDVAKQILAKQLNGVAMDLTANTYGAGAVGCTIDIATSLCQPVAFDGLSATPAGSNDAYVVKYAATNPYSSQWVSLFSGQGDASSASDQFATGTAVTANGTVVVSGTTNAGLVGGAINLPNNGQQTFLARVNGATGAGISAIQFDLGGGPLPGIAASKTSNLVAVCGSADKAATTLVPGAIFGGGTVKDVVIAVFDLGSATPLVPVWAKQLGGGADEQCDTVAIDDAGDVIVAGKYNWVTGQTLLDPGLGQLPDPNAGAGTPNSNRRHLWVAKYRGTDGLPLAQAAFGSGNGNHTAKSLAVDAAGNVVLGGAFTVSLPFGATTLTSAGSSDGFVAKLAVTGASFTPAWAVRIGAAGTAADLVNTVAVTSTGDVLAGGNFFGNTTGAASLTWSAGSDVFLLKVAGDVVAPATAPVTQFSAAYAAAGTQGLAAMACNRQGAGAALDAFAFGGSYDGQITISPLAPLPLSAGSSYLVFAPLAP